MAAVSFLLLIVGSVAALAFNSGLNPLGSSDPQPASNGGNEPTPKEDTGESTPASISPDAPPDPAFDSLLPTLEERTDAPIVLPAALPDELDKPAIDGYVSGGEEYGIVFPFGPTEIVAEGVSNAETLGTLTARPEEEDLANEYFDTESVEKIALPDGTEATLRYLVPAGRGGSQGPFWEGKFDKGGYTYDLTIIKPNEITEEEVKQTLSSMVLVRGQVSGVTEDEPATPATQPNPDKEALEAFGREYDAANRSGDWQKTYSMLEEEFQQEFTEAEWVEKQQVLREVNGTPAPLESVTVQLEETSSDAPGRVTLNYQDETQDDLTVTTFRAVDDPNDDGGPRLILSDVVVSYMKGIPEDGANNGYGDTAKGQQEIVRSEAEGAAGDYYRASGNQDWDYTYDALDSETQAMFTREEWSQKNQWFADQGTTIYNIESATLDETAQEPLAEVAVRLTGEDGSSSIRTTYFVNENGEWKHRFGQEENDLFGPGVPFDEWVDN